MSGNQDTNVATPKTKTKNKSLTKLSAVSQHRPMLQHPPAVLQHDFCTAQNPYTGRLKVGGMENGHDGKLAEKLSGLALNDNHSNNNDDSLSRAVKAIEAAEAVIQQQEEENSRLRSELQKKLELLEKYVGQLTFCILVISEEATNTILNGTLNAFSSAAAAAAASDNNTGPALSHFSSPSTATSFSPTRYQLEGEYSSRLPQGLMPVPQVNNSNSIWKQDVPIKIREHEEEILQLRKQLAEFSIKEAQIRNEKIFLEKRIAYMRLAFDQQQQDLVDAASKALSYRQDIIEENIRLTYQLQAAQQERTTFVSSLLPLLAEYSLQPPVPDAQSIVSYVKRHEVTSGLVQVLFKHLQEKLIITESKLKDSQYQLATWRSDVNHSNFAPQSPSHSLGPTLTASSKNGLELVPQSVFSHGKTQIVSDAQTDSNWNLPGQYQGGSGGGIVSKNLEPDDLGRYSPIASSNSEMDYPDAEGQQIEREPPSNWRSGNSPYTPAQDDPSSSYPPYLPPVLEEPSSSFSEAAEDDPLPAIEGLQISGEAYPGRELQACGYSINGTPAWVRHMEDGSVNYIEGAKQPNYLVTADDVDTYLAIEVQPLDNRKRKKLWGTKSFSIENCVVHSSKGELVKVFANDHKKIACGRPTEMQGHIEKTLHSGHASYKVLFTAGFLDIWEPATLAIKRDGYSIKCSGPNGPVITEKFYPTTQRVLRADNNSQDISW
ncbi:hypothetical protein CXB51_004063 [Gossypium anomalum]|uniref:DUF7046 domain-containing protein n=1 Tax=Gossypium anomalum TaxID=47600 RepID=A0A8J5ZLZ3_9ROSI|nr:hypothetical protein CXB51_004063 [Gossypium anomalum]